MQTPTNAAQILREHGVYPLQDTLTNDAILATVCPQHIPVLNGLLNIFVDTNGYHIVWKQLKANEISIMETVSVDIPEELAAKLDYEDEAPDFANAPKHKDDDPGFVNDDISNLTSDDITRLKTETDILSKAKELLK